MPPKIPKTMPAATLAKLIGCSLRTFHRRVRDRQYPKAAHGEYNAKAVMAAEMARLAPNPTKVAILRETLRKLKRQNDLADSKMYPADAVAQFRRMSEAIIDRHVESMLVTVPPQVAGETETGVVRETLRVAITTMRNAVASEFGRMAEKTVAEKARR